MKFEEITGNAERIRESHTNNFAEWGGIFALPDYLERERLLHEIHVRNGLTHRLFAVINDESKVIAACETLSRPLYHGRGRYAQDHCVASVFTVPECRRQGVANFMLSHLVRKFPAEADQMSLWSDVGDYYCRFQFFFPLVFEGEHHWRKSIICQNMKADTTCELLDREKVNSQILPEHSSELIRQTDSLFRECRGEINACLVVPHLGLYEQLQFRAIYAADKLGLQKPTEFGARTLDGHGWISWTYFFDKKKMLILGAYGSANDIANLVSTAATEARKYDCYVELYESSLINSFTLPEEASLAAARVDFKTIERTSSLPMSRAIDGIWVFPGGYGWY